MKQDFEQTKRHLIDSYTKVIDVKREENESLMRALNK
jgi:hypothetical protein